MAERPLSPHLSVYKLKYTLTTSFANRLTGILLSAGLLVLAYWLMAVAGGQRAYVHANAVLSAGIFKLLFAGLLLAFAYHLVAGLRHLVWDTGHYLERSQSRRSAGLVVVFSLLLAAVFIYFAWFTGARLP
jgi:succinate dehydrogenase / fumarate reductase cytochrome b subunit